MEEWSWMNELPEEARNTLLTLLGLASIAIVLVYFFYVKNLNHLLQTIRPENRQMPPAQVWLLLVAYLGYVVDFLPLFTPLGYTGLVVLKYLISGFTLFWHFRTALKISYSIAAEHRSRGLTTGATPTLKRAMVYGIASLVDMPFSIHNFNTSLVYIIWLFVFVSWIAYWAETAKYKKELRALPAMIDSDSQVFHNLY